MNKKRDVLIQVDLDKCVGCWKCIERCHHNVLAKVELPLQKYIVVDSAENCIGCLHCMSVCRYQAIRVVRSR